MNVKMSFFPLKLFENIEFYLELNLKDILEKRHKYVPQWQQAHANNIKRNLSLISQNSFTLSGL